ncbi:methionyl-tRNA synthetase beta subunit [Tieghemostelium lacteum]|uniref:Methionyl-tRNA synthetase beta subunit n=1 Tax=Tieghemostelium lacteum TaxID=361077 RepID=A0A151Z631_TIELA|nr:methionyl-tRNA synthetase beta subunit [Tieghemostelium lacteum]|eukprot:KYQ89398.1 methionyl-tRNA synthetase beta subunit [Tieghemostelium lacteum]
MQTTSNEGNSHGNSHLASFRDRIVTIPLTTRFFLFACIFIFLLQCIQLLNLYSFCLSPSLLFSNPLHFYTIFTNNFLHADILHILFNMLAFVPLSSTLEKRKFGTFLIFYLILLFCILISLLQLFIAYLASVEPFRYDGFYYSCGIGFSGIIFALLEIECLTGNPNDSRSFFGFKMASKLYPWILLFVFQIIFPSASFLAHLSGILIGYVYTLEMLDPLIPTSNKISNIESSTSNPIGKLTTWRGYIVNPSSSFYTNTSSTSSNTSTSTTNSVFSTLRTAVSNTTNSFRGTGQQLGYSSVPTRPTLPYSDNINMSTTPPQPPPQPPNTSNITNSNTIPIDE